MDKASRKVVKATIRGALASRARQLPMTEHDAAVFFKLAALRDREGEDAVLRVAKWAAGAPLCRLAWRERCSERVIAIRIDENLDLMRRLDAPISSARVSPFPVH